MKEFKALRRTMTLKGEVNASANDIFPLLCPTREYDWIQIWDCKLIYSDSGFAEPNCIFQTEFEGERWVWSVSGYDPENTCIEFTIFITDHTVMHYRVKADALAENKSTLSWTRTFTALKKEGNLYIETLDEKDFHFRMGMLNKMVEHYLKTGEMMKVS